MINNLFTASPAIWTALIAGLIALPLLIHLINLVRHKTVEWAAMEFLLKSHKRNRNWVWLKQLFLLLSRIAALLLALFMLSQIGCEENRIAALLGGRSTHHYVLLDDSFSMSDRDSEGSAFDRARSTLSLIAARASNRDSQRFTLLRFSAGTNTRDLATNDPVGTSSGNGETTTDVANEESQSLVADIDNELVDDRFGQRVEDLKAQLSVSNFPATLDLAVESAAHLIKQRVDENSIVYVLSDFRAKDWQTSGEAHSALEEIRKAGGAVELIHCAKTAHANLAITALHPSSNVRVAEAPLMMEIEVTNFSQQVAEKVQVKISSLPFPDASMNGPGDAISTPEELPTVFIETIEAGQTVTRYFPVYFRSIGKHAVKAELTKDAVELDNVRHCVVETKAAAEVLIIDEADHLHASYMSLALSPNLMTGIRPEIRGKDYLRDNDAAALRRFDVIFLCDVDRLDDVAVRHLEEFTEQGGGLGYFVGPRTSTSFYNASLYKSGTGIFPVELREPTEVPEQLEQAVADISAQEHPMFAPVLGLKNSLLDLVQVRTVFSPSLEWLANKPAQATVVATVRGDKNLPLAVEGRYGKGKTMAFLTTAGPVWNNWMRNATFPPILLLLEDHLASGHYPQEENLVGQSLLITAQANQVTPEVTALVPSFDGSRLEQKIKLQPFGQGNDTSGENWREEIFGGENWMEKILPYMDGSVPKRNGKQSLLGFLARGNEASNGKYRSSTSQPGIYDVWFRQLDATRTVDRYAYNVDCVESELALANRGQILKSLESVNPAFVDWDQFNPEPKQKPASSLNRFFLILLLGLLIGEQALAYSASYHR